MITSVFCKRGHQVQAKTGRIIVPVFETCKIIFLPVESIKPVRGSHPEMMVPVLVNTADKIVAQTITVRRVIPVNNDFVSVIAVEPVTSAKPDKSKAVLKDGFNGTIGNSFFIWNMGKPEFGWLGWQGSDTGEKSGPKYNKV